ncbi:MAG TPA: tRNA uridine-5-carboxymethylaminomethyl(34) synthesis enzyme MnmG, partial [Candidatus Sericytochromatia bacterium]
IASDTQQVIKGSITLAELLRRPGVHYIDLERHGLGNPALNSVEKEGAEIEIKYSGYLQRQQNQIDLVSRQTNRQLPPDLDYALIDTLSKEAREKLAKVKPLTVGQAGRIGGVNPADINALLVYLELRYRQKSSEVSMLA